MNASLAVKKDRYYAVLNYKDKSGKWRKKWIALGLPVRDNRRKAEAMLPALMEKYKHLEQLELPANAMFGEYALEWLERRKTQVELSTFERYDGQTRTHLIPYFGTKKLLDITPRDISEFYAYKAKSGRADGKGGALSHTTMRSISSLLRRILQQAVIEGLLMRNPADGIPLQTKSKEREYVFLNKDEANALLKAFEGELIHELVFVTLYYGLRRSEVLGLRWQDIDFEHDTLTIQHTVVKNLTIVEKDSTKTASSNATFALIPQVKEVLLNLRKKQDEYREICKECYHETGYVFTQEDGTMIRPDSLTRRFEQVLKKNKLKPMRFHDLRHSTASMLFDLGWDIKAIQTWLRHADIETTGNIYTHISNERKRIMSTELNDFIKF